MMQTKTIHVPPAHQAAIDEQLRQGQTGSFVLRFDVLEITQTGLALVWVYGKETSKISLLRLHPLTMHEITQRQNDFPIRVQSTWVVLGKQADGYVVAQWDPPQIFETLQSRTRAS